MNVTLQIRGHSDDIIVVEGGHLTDEFYDPFLHFDDGTVLKVQYSPPGYSGKWKIEIVKHGTATVGIAPALNEDKDFSDIATVTGEITRIESWRKEEPTKYEITEKIANYDIDESDASTESLLQAWRLISGDK